METRKKSIKSHLELEFFLSFHLGFSCIFIMLYFYNHSLGRYLFILCKFKISFHMHLTIILNSLQSSNQMLVFVERGKPEYPEKNLSEQSREPTNSAHIQESNRDTLVEGEQSHHSANPAPVFMGYVVIVPF